MKVLSSKELKAEIKKLKGWSVVKGKLYAEYLVKDFRSAMAFVNMVSIEAEVMNHHPEWSNSYNRLSFHFCTHDAGNKITNLDVAMAKYISRVAKFFV